MASIAVTLTLILVLVVFTLDDVTDFDEDSSLTVMHVPNRNVNWSCCSLSSQWFGTYVQSNFTHHRLNCFVPIVDLVCFSVCFA